MNHPMWSEQYFESRIIGLREGSMRSVRFQELSKNILCDQREAYLAIRSRPVSPPSVVFRMTIPIVGSTYESPSVRAITRL